MSSLKSGEFSTLPLIEVAKAIFKVRELALDEVNELSFGRPLTPNSDDALYAAISGNQLIALLANKDGLAKPTAVFAAAS